MQMIALRADGYKMLNFLGDEKKKPQVEALQYIDRISTLSGTPIQDWDIVKVFGSGEGNNIITDKGEINKRFFEYRNSIPVSPKPEPKIQLSPALLVKLQARQKQYIETLVRNKQADIDSHLRSADTRQKQANELISLANKLYQEMNAMQGTPSSIPDEIAKVIHGNFWDLWDVNNEYIDFVTRYEIHLNHQNRSAGIDIQLNMGRYKVRYLFEDSRMYCYPHHNNIVSPDNRSHPHVYDSGRICWGSAQDMASQALYQGKLSSALEVLATILVNYNPDSPVYNIAQFQKYKRKTGPEPVCPLTPEKLNNPDAIFGKEVVRRYETRCEDGCDGECENPDEHETYEYVLSTVDDDSGDTDLAVEDGERIDF